MSPAKKKKKKATKKKAVSTPGVRSSFGSVLGLLFLGMMLVLSARGTTGEALRDADLIPFAAWIVSSALLCVLLRMGGYAGPPGLPGGILALSAVGVLVRSRMTGSVEGLEGWSLWIQPVGFLWMWAAWVFSRRGRLEAWKGWGAIAYLLSLAVIAALVAGGNRFRGALYGPGGMTPTEILKLFIPLALAGFFASDPKRWSGRGVWNPPLGHLLLLGSGWAVLCGLLVLQRDLGLVVLLSLTLVVMLVQATRSWSWAVMSGALMAAGGWAVWQGLDHGARRLEAWLDPFADPTGAGWQVLQGLSGLYAGGFAGTGLGEGRPDRLPIASSDFVYAVYGEELGFLGCLLLLILIAGLIRQSARTAASNPEAFSSLLAVGLTAQLAIQFFVNIAGVVTLLPVTGITLPYISQGGSSFWVASVQFGLLLGIGDLKRK